VQRSGLSRPWRADSAGGRARAGVDARTASSEHGGAAQPNLTDETDETDGTDETGATDGTDETDETDEPVSSTRR
jgi:hypothetical protein